MIFKFKMIPIVVRKEKPRNKTVAAAAICCSIVMLQLKRSWSLNTQTNTLPFRFQSNLLFRYIIKYIYKLNLMGWYKCPFREMFVLFVI